MALTIMAFVELLAMVAVKLLLNFEQYLSYRIDQQHHANGLNE